MRITRSLESLHLENAWITIGVYDGVHLGHQKLLHDLIAGAHAHGVPAVVVTFHPHPLSVLKPEWKPQFLTTPEERAEIFKVLGVDVVVIHPFNREISKLSARDFLVRLKSHLGFEKLQVGFNFAMGRNRKGDIPTLRKLGEELGYKLEVISPLENEDKAISSSRIRELIRDGKVDQAANQLGRPYRIEGKVIKGVGRGKKIGIPTANLETHPNRVIPKKGVYACEAYVGGEKWGATTNIGVRPTFGNEPAPTSVETHILDFEENIYDESILLDFLERIRDELKFSSVEKLVHQIHRDTERTRTLLQIKKAVR